MQIDGLIDFTPKSLGSDYTGVWTDAKTLAITVVSASGGDLVRGDTITIIADGTDDLRNEFGTNAPCTDSAAVVGSWGAALVAHWEFDETMGLTAFDSVGPNDGALAGYPGDDSQWVGGQIAGALHFDGQDDHVEVPNDASLNPTFGVTTAIWVNATDWSSNRRIFMGKPYGLLAEFGDLKTTMGLTTGNVEIRTTLPPAGEWHHVCQTYDGVTIRIYMDGQEVISLAAPGQLNTNANPLFIGTQNAGTAPIDRFYGEFNDFRIYDGALSPEAVEAVYQLGILPRISIEATDEVACEPSDKGTFTLYRQGGDPAAELTVDLEIRQQAGDATPVADYSTFPDITGGTVTIPSNDPSVTVDVWPVDDGASEGPETVVVTILDTGTGYLPSDVPAEATATVTIGDDDSAPGAFDLLTPTNVATGEPLAPEFTWEVATGAAYYHLVVADNASFDTPIIDQNPVAASYTPATDVLDPSTPYWWKVTAHNAISGTPASNNPFTFTTAYGTPEVTIEATDEYAFESSTDTGLFTVTRTGGNPGVVLPVSYTVAGTAGADLYVALTLAVAIQPGQDSATILVTPLNDAIAEGAKTVVVTLTPSAEYGVGTPSSATVTIGDDDQPPEDFVLTAPTNGDTGVSLTPTLGWDLAPGATSYTVVLADNAAFTDPVVDNISLTANSYDLLAGLLANNTLYYWQVTAHNDSGDTPATGAPQSFRTELDIIPPTVLRTEPDGGDDRAEADAVIIVRFSEPMDTGATEAAFSITPVVDGDASWSQQDKTLTFTPSAELDWEATYTVTITTAATDTATPTENTLDGDKDGAAEGSPDDDYTFTFTTAEALVGLATGPGCVPVAGPVAAATLATLATLAALAALAALGILFRRRDGAK